MVYSKTKKYLIALLKIIIAILAIFYLFRSGWLTKETFAKLLKIDNIPALMLSSFFFMIAQVLATSRLLLLLGTIDFHLRFLKAFKLVMIGNFFNTVIPGMVGGDLIKGFYLVKSEENRRGQSAGIVIMDRALGFLALTFIGGVSINYLLGQKNSILYPYRNESYIALAIVGSIFGLFGAFFVFGRNQRVRAKIGSLFTSVFRRSIFYYLLDGLGALAKHPPIFVISFFVSIIIQLFSLAGLLILSRIGFASFTDVIPFAAVSTVVLLLSVIPVTPGNLGWTELMAAFGWSVISSNAGAETFFSWRIVTVLCSLPGGLLYLFFNSGRASAEEEPKSVDFGQTTIPES